MLWTPIQTREIELILELLVIILSARIVPSLLTTQATTTTTTDPFCWKFSSWIPGFSESPMWSPSSLYFISQHWSHSNIISHGFLKANDRFSTTCVTLYCYPAQSVAQCPAHKRSSNSGSWRTEHLEVPQSVHISRDRHTRLHPESPHTQV